MALEDEIAGKEPEMPEDTNQQSLPASERKEPEKTQEPEPEPPKAKATEPEESQIADLLDAEMGKDKDKDDESEPQDTERAGLVKALAAKRATIRELKDQLKQLQTRPAAETAELKDVLAELNDEDFVSVAQLRKAIGRVRPGLSREDVEELLDQRESRRDRDAVEARALASEAAAVKAHDDFAEVITTAKELNLISQDDRRRAFASADPAEQLYQTAQRKLAKLTTLVGKSESKGEPAKKDTKKSSEPPENQQELSEAELAIANKTDDEEFATAFPAPD